MFSREPAYGVHHAGVEHAGAFSSAFKCPVCVKTRPLLEGAGVLRLDVVHAHAIDETEVLFAQGGFLYASDKELL